MAWILICVCTLCHGKHVAPKIARAACRLLKAIFCAMILYRRQIQLQSVGNLGARQALQMVLKRDGPKGLYKGFLPNALKNLPNKGNWGAACILAGVEALWLLCCCCGWCLCYCWCRFSADGVCYMSRVFCKLHCMLGFTVLCGKQYQLLQLLLAYA